VNGEYIYSPSSSYSAKCTARSADHEVPESPVSDTSSASKESSRGPEASKDVKKSRRASRIGWGSSRPDKRQSRLAVSEVRWDGSSRA